MRTVAAVLLVVVLGPAAADEKPGTIVIRPSGSPRRPEQSAPPAPAKPDDPRFHVLRPQTPGQPPPPPRLVNDGQSGPKPVPAGVDPVPILAPRPADEPPTPDKPKETANGKVVFETWDTCYLKGQKVGYFRVTVREHEKNGKTYWYAVKEQKLTVARFGQVVEMWAEDTTLETPAGDVLTVRMRQGLSKDQMLAVVGTVTGDKLAVRGEGGAAEATKEIPWPTGVLGWAKESTFYKDKKPKPGDALDYLYYEGRLNRVVKINVVAKAVENVALVEGQAPRKMLRLEAAMEPLRDKDGKLVFPIPPATVWCDADTFEPVRTDQDAPHLGGRLIILRTTKEVALRPVGKVPDLFDVQSVRLDRSVPDIHELAGVTYRVTLPNDPEPTGAFSADTRQAVKNPAADGKSFELHVTAVRSPLAGQPTDPPGDEYLGTSFFIDWQTDEVKRHAATATAGLPATATAWQKAQAVEKWVRANMKAVEFSQAMATTSQVAKNLSGDCTEYSMLAVGMCRSLGIPARTALGLVYAPGAGGAPFLAYHMWFEVYADGRWVALDGTLARGSVGPGHIKITDASWHGERSFAPLLPVLRVLMGGPKVEVVGTTR